MIPQKNAVPARVFGADGDLDKRFRNCEWAKRRKKKTNARHRCELYIDVVATS